MTRLLTICLLLMGTFCMAQEVQVMTFNIRYDNPDDPVTWDERKKEVSRAMFFHDIIGIQEGLQHQVDYLDEQLVFHDWVGVGRDDGERGGEHTAIFYNRMTFSLLHSETIWLSPWPKAAGSVGWDADLPRTATIAIFKHNESGKTVRVINTHLDHEGVQSRICASHILRGYAALATEDHVVILGDFNADPDSKAYEMMNAEPFSDSYVSSALRCREDFTTYSTFNPSVSILLRIDHIFVNTHRVNWICADEYIINEHYISDHLPVFISLDL
ncbi:MAG: endonuclease/exonuclease/phosphatase family protein [Flavobacteriales bacterium]|nr:endonuclease/exonuclease/phosphatase family protein [Flavobacteriales bacterium]